MAANPISPFSYRIVAKRKGYEDLRLAKTDEQKMIAMTTAEGDIQDAATVEAASDVKSCYQTKKESTQK